MSFFIKKLFFTLIFNSCIFVLLLVGIQNSSNKRKVDLLINKTIEDAEFPNGLRVGLIKKEDNIIIPDKETKIEIHDEILFLCMSHDIKKAEELFQVRSEY